MTKLLSKIWEIRWGDSTCFVFKYEYSTDKNKRVGLIQIVNRRGVEEYYYGSYEISDMLDRMSEGRLEYVNKKSISRRQYKKILGVLKECDISFVESGKYGIKNKHDLYQILTTGIIF